MSYDTLVVSGNGTNALSTLGAIQKLLDDKIISLSTLTAYYGTSSGSIISTLLAIGFEPLEILAHICVNRTYSKILGINGNNLSLGGLLNFDMIERELDNIIVTKLGYLPTMNCIRERFGKTLVFVTYNLTSNEKVYLNPDTHPDLLVTKAIRMSSNFPFVFPPYEYNGNYYVDGGIVDNFPLMHAQLSNRKCMGLCSNNVPKPYSPETTYFELFGRLITTFVSSMLDNIQVFPTSKKLKLSYPPSFFNFSSTNFELIKIFDNGYDTCAKLLLTE